MVTWRTKEGWPALQVSFCATPTQSFVFQYPVSFMQPRGGVTFVSVYIFGLTYFHSFSGT